MVTGIRLENIGAVIRAENFEIVSGVHVSEGGGDEGPDPHRLLEASLAACTIITVQMYANRKSWPLVSTNVRVQIDKEDASGTVFVREISFQGDLTTEQRQRLFEIANKCPIHRLLNGKIEILSKFKET